MVLPILFGAIAGALVGLIGLVVVVRMAAKIKAGKEDASGSLTNAAFWQMWGLGMLIRLVLLTAFTFLFMAYFKDQITKAVLAMFAVYLGLLFCETGWLCNLMASEDNGTNHG